MIDLRSAEVILHIRRCVEYVEILIGNGLFFFQMLKPTLAAKGGDLVQLVWKSEGSRCRSTLFNDAKDPFAAIPAG